MRRPYPLFIVTHRPSGRRARPWLAAAIVALAALLAVLVGTAAALSGPVHLRDGTAWPRTGTPTTTISFAVTYRHDDREAPAFVRLVVDGTSHAMTAAGGTPDFGAGALFRFTTTLPAGTHVISFWAADVHGFADRDQAGLVKIADKPAGGSDSGPDGGVTPGSGHTPVGGGTSGGGTSGGGSGGSSASQPPAPAPPPAAPGPGGATSGGSPSAGPASGQHHGAGSSTGTSTGGDRAGRTDPPGAADHTTLPPPRDGTADGGASTGHPTGPSAAPIPAPADATAGGDTAEHADGRTHGGWPPADAVVLASEGGSAVGAGRNRPGGRSGGPSDDSLPAVLRPGGLTPLERSIVAGLSTAATTVAAMAFLFGKRRRDDDPPAPDEVLSASAARLTSVPAASLVPPAQTVDEAQPAALAPTITARGAQDGPAPLGGRRPPPVVRPRRRQHSRGARAAADPLPGRPPPRCPRRVGVFRDRDPRRG